MAESIDVLQGTLDLLILKALTWGPMHGFEVSRWLLRTTDDAMAIEEGALYPALHRMERRKWLSSEWAVTEQGRRAKYYQLTREGRDQLRIQTTAWRRYVAVVDKIMAAARAR
ncbi:MAG: PadR family transcriptional regulator [Gemmatimonadales bacterium]